MPILDLLYPPRCPFCGAFVEKRQIMCVACEGTMQRLSIDECPVCEELWEACSCPRSFLDHVTAVYAYGSPAGAGVRNLKFSKHMQGLYFFSAQMTAYIRYYFGETPADAVVPVPIGAKRRNRRGFNQAELLARAVAEDLRLPLDADLLRKTVDTQPQSLQSWRRRQGNVAGVYETAPHADLRGRTILLVDDVCTSGATLTECAKMLKYAGADKVLGAVLCKAGRKAAALPVNSFQQSQIMIK